MKTTWFAGGAKAWRRATGMWAALYKNLCLMEGKGAYGDWLKLHDLNRSSMDDLIRRFEEEATWEAQDQLILPESGKTDETSPALPPKPQFHHTWLQVSDGTNSARLTERTMSARKIFESKP